MTHTQGIVVGSIIGGLSVLALFVEPPAFAVALFGWVRGNFTRGRHHLHAFGPARPFGRERLTVDALRARLVSEATFHLTIVPDVQGFRDDVREALRTFEIPRGTMAVDCTLLGGGGPGRGIVDQHAGIAG